MRTTKAWSQNASLVNQHNRVARLSILCWAMAGGAIAGLMVANNLKRLTEGLSGKTTWKSLEPWGFVLTGVETEAALLKLRSTWRALRQRGLPTSRL